MKTCWPTTPSASQFPPKAVSQGSLTLRLHWFLDSFNKNSYSVPNSSLYTDRAGFCFYALRFCFAILGEDQKLETPCTQGFVSLSALPSLPRTRINGVPPAQFSSPASWRDETLLPSFHDSCWRKESVLHLVWCHGQKMCSSCATHTRSNSCQQSQLQERLQPACSNHFI